jgi:hypothetical protein
MPAKLKIENRGDEIIPLHPNFVLIEQMVSDKKIFMGISHRSYVKLILAVAAILIGVLKCQTQFCKRTTQESFLSKLCPSAPSCIHDGRHYYK